ncbi:MAG: PilZ domain-containing protein [Sandaracinaceae bacterium]|nr:PilZ domain-containing protein [Sandaracinaceae bacterium]
MRFELVPSRRRRTLRRAFRTDCQAVQLHGFRLVGQQILDLSPRGALIHCTDPVAPGDELVLSFRAPHQGPYIDTTAEVRRVFSKHGRPVAGMSFIDLEAEARDELLVRLAGLPPPVPTRAHRVDYAETVWRIAQGA